MKRENVIIGGDHPFEVVLSRIPANAVREANELDAWVILREQLTD